MNKMMADMTDISHLIKQEMDIPFSDEAAIVDPFSKWESDYIDAVANTSPPVHRSPYHRPPGEESRVTLRLRFNKEDTGADMPPHLMKHLL